MIYRWMVIFLLYLAVLHADVYYAKAEPFKKQLIKSNVSGKVIYVDESIEGKMAGEDALITIDADIDKREYERLINQIKLLKNSVLNYKKVYEKRWNYYHSIKNMKSKSKSNKDSAYYAQAGAKQSLNAAMIELDTSEQALFSLKKQIRDKNIICNKWYVYALHVTEGDYVTMGTPLVTVADISKIKLTLFLSAFDASHADAMQLFVDDKKVDVKIQQIWKMSDSEHLSSYEAKLVLPARKQLSQLVKVELRENNDTKIN